MLIRLILQKLQSSYRAVQWAAYCTCVALRLTPAIQLRLLPATGFSDIIYVKVSSIEIYIPISSRHESWIRSPMFVGGDWDLDNQVIIPGVNDPSPGFRTMYQMFVEDLPVEETAEYEEMTGQILTLGRTNNHKLQTTQQVVECLEGYRDMFSDMKEKGYKTQEELDLPAWNDDIWICLGRNGDSIYYGRGSHRLAMARILDMEYIPVGVRYVHPIWGKRCARHYGSGVLEAVRRHIDSIDHRDAVLQESVQKAA